MNSQTTSRQTTSVSKPSQSTSNNHQSLCCYTNHTSHVQVIRLMNQSHTNWQRVIFPGERFLFEADSESNLEIVNQVVSSLVNCRKLLVKLES